MNLTLFRANVDFSQWSLSIEGMPVERKRQNRHGEHVKEHLIEQMRRVAQPAEIRKIIGVPVYKYIRLGKIDLSEKNGRVIYPSLSP